MNLPPDPRRRHGRPVRRGQGSRLRVVAVAVAVTAAASVVPAGAAPPDDVEVVRPTVRRVTPAGEFGLATPTGVAFDPQEQLLIVGDADGSIAESELDGHGIGTRPARGRGAVDDLAFDPRARRLVAAKDAPGRRSVDWDRRRGRLVQSTETLVAHDPATDLLYSYEEADQTLVGRDEGGEVRTVVELAAVDGGAVEPVDAVFAPTADTTDDPEATSLYLTDGSGLLELSFATVEVTAAPIAATATHVRTVELWQLDPPSPDSAGITYIAPTGHLLVSDSEVNEMPIFEGANLFELTGTADDPAGGPFTLVGTGDTTPWSAEPTGVGYDPASGHLFSSNDDADEVFEVVDGGDGQFGTADDTVTSFDTRGYGNNDAEGVAVDTLRDDLLVVDGVSMEVFRVDAGPNGVYQGGGDDVISSFDVQGFGAEDPEGVAYNHLDDTVLVLDGRSRSVYELDEQGTLLRTIDISSVFMRQAAGITLAPASDGSGAWHVFIVERGVDNNSDPSENDGRLHEFSVDFGPSGDVAPVAEDDSATTAVDEPVVIDVVANDTDLNGDLDPTSVSVLTGPGDGTADASAGDGTVTYSPGAGFAGDDTFDYEVCDLAGLCDSATVSVSVLAPVPPDAIDDSAATQAGQPVVVDVVANDVAGSSPIDPGTVTVTAGPSSGSAVPGGDGTVTYTPSGGLVGDDAFAYRVCDTAGGCDVASVSISVLAGQPTTVQVRVAASTDDAEERATGGVSLQSSDLELVFDSSDQTVGMRFVGVDVPVGAVVTAAHLQFTTDEVSSGAVDLLVRGQLSPSPATFAGINGNVSSRPRTSASVAWSPPDWPVRGAAGAAQRTPDLAAVVQEIVDQSGWSAGNAVAMIVTGTGERVAESFDGSTADAPLLEISYLLDTGPRPPSAEDDTAVTGVDTPVVIDVVANDSDPDGDLDPSTVAVTSGPADGTTDTTAGDGTVTYTPRAGFDGVDAFDYEVCDAAGACATATVTVSVVAPVPPEAVDDTATTQAGAPVLVRVLDNDLEGSSPLDPTSVAVTVAPTDGSTDSSAGDGTVTYSPAGGFVGDDTFTYRVCDTAGACDTAAVTVSVLAGQPTTVTSRVASGDDDAEEQPSGRVGLTSSDLELVVDRDPQVVGIRFTGVDVPPGAVITAAHVQFTTDEESSGPSSLTVRGQRSANASTFVNTNGNVSSRTLTGASVGWSPPDWTVRGASGPDERTPDLSAVVQEIVDLPGWASGNAVAMIVTGSGSRVAEAFNGDAGSAPLLQVSYLVDAGPRAPTAADDSATTAVDTPVVIDVVANDDDLNGDLDPASVSVTVAPTDGATDTTAADGTVTYTPDQGTSGTDSFEYEVCDSTALCDTATVAVTVVAPQPPVAADDGASTTTGTPVVVDVVANDVDPDGDLDASSVAVTVAPSDGATDTSAGDGSVTYTPDAGFDGEDAFTYRVCDLTGLCDTAQVTVSVLAGAPTAVDVRVSTASDDAEETPSGRVTLTSSDLELVFDREDQTVGVRFANVDVPTGAVITDAWVQFTVDETSTGPALLTIEGQRAPDTLTFDNTDANISSRARTSASVAWSPPDWTVRGAAGPGQRTPDLSAIVQEIVQQPGWTAGNAVTVIVTGSGERVAESFNGDSAAAPLLHVEYLFDDGPLPPVAVDDSAGTSLDAPVVIDVVANDSDPNGDLDPATVTVTTPPANGTTDTSAGDGTVTYDPASGFVGDDSFVYRVCDAGGRCDTATVSVTVADPSGNAAPVVDAGVDQTLTVADEALLIGTWTDDDLPYETELVDLSWSVVSGPGVVTFAEDAEALTAASFSSAGSYVLRLTADDGLASSTDDLVVTVTQAAPDTLLVPQQYATIQDAVDAANDHDLVLVDRGVYVETLNISKTITLASTYYTTGDPTAVDETVIQSPDILLETVTFGSGAGMEARIVGFTVRDGKDGVKIRGTASVIDNKLLSLDTDAVDFSEDARGRVTGNLMQDNGDDGVDIDTADVLIDDNTMQANEGDAVEIRTIDQSADVLTITMRGNRMLGNLQDGIQLIDDDQINETLALLIVDRNLIQGNVEAGFGLMDQGTTTEDYRAASVLETIVVTHNSFIDNDHGITGGDRSIVLNNLVIGHTNIGMKGVDGDSVAAHNLFWDNGVDHSGSNVEVGSSVFADPLLAPDSTLQPGSPAIDAGTESHTLSSGYVLVATEPDEYLGGAPDLGALEAA